MVISNLMRVFAWYLYFAFPQNSFCAHMTSLNLLPLNLRPDDPRGTTPCLGFEVNKGSQIGYGELCISHLLHDQYHDNQVWDKTQYFACPQLL